MISGLAQIIQRVDPSIPLRYLSQTEAATGCSVAGRRYRALANERHALREL